MLQIVAQTVHYQCIRICNLHYLSSLVTYICLNNCKFLYFYICSVNNYTDVLFKLGEVAYLVFINILYHCTCTCIISNLLCIHLYSKRECQDLKSCCVLQNKTLLLIFCRQVQFLLLFL